MQSTGGEALAETEKNILGNHMERLWEIVRDSKARSNETADEQNGAKRKGGRIDFVLDNAGFELYCDCVFGEPRPTSPHYLILRCCNAIPSGLPSSNRIRNRDPFPRKTLSVVRVGRHDEGLGLVAQYHELWASFPQGDSGRNGELEAHGQTVEGACPQAFIANKFSPVKFLSNTRKRENGSTKPILFGARGTLSGISITRLRICSSISRTRSLLYSRAI